MRKRLHACDRRNRTVVGGRQSYSLVRRAGVVIERAEPNVRSGLGRDMRA
ncbi:hypothetical protein [Nocardia sp. NBC_01388]